jgi:IclR helix-turn-helix domain
VVLIDEHAELVDESETAADLVEDLAQLGRAPGVELVTATQRPTVAALGSGSARAQLDVRICLRVREVRDTDLVLGQGAYRTGWRPDRLDRPGKFLIAAPGQGLDTPRPARAYLLTDHSVRATAACYAPHRPTLDPLSAAAAGPAASDSQASPTAGTADIGEPGSPTEPAATGGTPDALLELLRAAGPAGLPITDLIKRSGLPRSTAYKRLAALAEAGLAEQITRGHWRAAPAVREPEEER